MKRILPVGSETQKRLSELEYELYETRMDIIELMPVEISNLLRSYGQCTSSADFRIWREAIVKEIASKVALGPTGTFSEPRAPCPLCGSKSLGPFAPGFVIPDGLRRHLLGIGNAEQCVVTRAALRIAKSELQETFEEAHQEERRKLEERRKTEQVYLIDPRSPPELLTDVFLTQPRTLDDLKWAEERLVRLGFTIADDNNVRSYQLPWEECVVFADPRGRRRIDFRILKENGRRTKQGRYKEIRRFKLLDGWKNDLNEKFNRLLVAAHGQT